MVATSLFLLACGDIEGEPIVRVDGEPGSPGDGSDAGGNSSAVASSRCPDPDIARRFVLSLIGPVRADRGLDELIEDECLSDIAQAGSIETEETGAVQAKWLRECNQRRPDCECNWQDETQAFRSVSGNTWDQNLGDLVAGMLEPDDNLMSPDYSRIGVGIACWNDGQSVILTLDFAP